MTREIRRVDTRRFTTDGAGLMRPIGEPRPPFEEPSGPMHWKPGSMNVDGAMCGRTGVPFTGRADEVQCVDCRALMPTA